MKSKMADIGTASDNINALARQLPGAIERLIQRESVLIGDYISDQLYSGKDGNERDLSPDYLSDPYFNRFTNPQRAARGYMAWKMDITPPARSFIGLAPRSPRVPNLWINGYYHSRISVTPKARGVEIGNSAGFAGEIEAKYGSAIYKVSPTARRHFIAEHLQDFLRAALNPRGYELRV